MPASRRDASSAVDGTAPRPNEPPPHRRGRHRNSGKNLQTAAWSQPRPIAGHASRASRSQLAHPRQHRGCHRTPRGRCEPLNYNTRVGRFAQPKRAASLVWWSIRLITGRSTVRICCGPPARPSWPPGKVRFITAPSRTLWGRRSVGRSLPSQGRGRGFKSPRLHLFSWWRFRRTFP
jgi:hypothetical protein